MVTDQDGNALTETKDRRDEIQRCIDIIGWGWGKFGDRLGLKLPSAYAVKNCKRSIADSDIRWLQDLAAAHIARPRPAEANDAGPVMNAPIVQDMPAFAQAPAAPPVPGPEVMQQLRDELAEQSAVAIVSSITGVYLSAVPGVGPDAMTTEQVAGARWALGELAQSLGVLDLVQEQLRAHQSRAASNQIGQMQGAGMIGARQPMA